MATTLLSNITSAVMSELLASDALPPLRSRIALLPFLNQSSIDGAGSTNRKIPKRKDIADAQSESEGTAFVTYQQLTFDTAITLTPASYVQGVNPSMQTVRSLLGGVTHEEALRAIEGGTAEALPLVGYIVQELREAHARAMEKAALALFSGLSDSAGTTNTVLSFDGVLDAQVALMENKPEHRGFACFIDSKGINDLRTELLTGTSSNLFSSGWGSSFLESVGQSAADATVPFGNVLGTPIIEVDGGLQATANAGVDRVGAVVCVGRGATGEAGSLRGFAEICFGHPLSIGVQYDLVGNMVEAIGRSAWAAGEHTDEHGVKLIYKKV